MVLGHRHPSVEAAAQAQAALGDCQNGPGAVMVELAELLVATVCCTIARAHTGRRTSQLVVRVASVPPGT